ncbi:MAG: NADH-quinone oxidoreductase subunit NuoI [bacterium]|nr:NADH-quinone oxidoreductase subunit NuoI [bacterium]
MAIEVSKNKWKMTFGERIYIIPILHGMWVTLTHLFAKKVTIQYPEEKPVISPRWRGRHVLKRNEKGQERCVGCQMCELACPADAIYIEAAEVPPEKRHEHPTERYAKVYNIDMLRCIFCGMCEEACPEAAIFLTPYYEFVDDSREKLVYNKEMLTEKVGGPILYKD